MKRLQSISQHRVRRWFLVLLLANALYILFAGLYLRPLTSREIIKFELAKEVHVAEAIVQDWTATGKYEKAIQSIYLDFLFILLYTAGLSVTCVFISRFTAHEVLMRTGYFFSYLLVAAGICDVIENVALLRSLHGSVNNWNVILAFDMATTKFSILILAALFIGVCLVFWPLRKIDMR